MSVVGENLQPPTRSHRVVSFIEAHGRSSAKREARDEQQTQNCNDAKSTADAADM